MHQHNALAFPTPLPIIAIIKIIKQQNICHTNRTQMLITPVLWLWFAHKIVFTIISFKGASYWILFYWVLILNVIFFLWESHSIFKISEWLCTHLFDVCDWPETELRLLPLPLLALRDFPTDVCNKKVGLIPYYPLKSSDPQCDDIIQH